MADDVKLIQYIEVILVHLGYDTDSPLFKDTAIKFANTIRPFMANVEVEEGSIIAPATEVNLELASVPVTIVPIKFNAMCARHFMPIFGSAGIVYVASDKHVPIRSINHVVEYFAQQFIDQPTVTRRIGLELATGLDPRGLHVVVSARHTCEGDAIVTTEWGASISVNVVQSLVERVEKSVR